MFEKEKEIEELNRDELAVVYLLALTELLQAEAERDVMVKAAKLAYGHLLRREERKARQCIMDGLTEIQTMPDVTLEKKGG